MVSLLLTYPFDFASAKIMSDLGKKETLKYSNISDVFSKVSATEKKVFFTKYYKGMSYAILEAFPQGFITLLGSSIIYSIHTLKLNEKDNVIVKYWKLFGCMATLGFLTSVITYPLDTLKRRIQVTNSADLTGENMNIVHSINYMRRNLNSEMYR